MNSYAKVYSSPKDVGLYGEILRQTVSPFHAKIILAHGSLEVFTLHALVFILVGMFANIPLRLCILFHVKPIYNNF